MCFLDPLALVEYGLNSCSLHMGDYLKGGRFRVLLYVGSMFRRY